MSDVTNPSLSTEPERASQRSRNSLRQRNRRPAKWLAEWCGALVKAKSPGGAINWRREWDGDLDRRVLDRGTYLGRRSGGDWVERDDRFTDLLGIGRPAELSVGSTTPVSWSKMVSLNTDLPGQCFKIERATGRFQAAG